MDAIDEVVLYWAYVAPIGISNVHRVHGLALLCFMYLCRTHEIAVILLVVLVIEEYL